MTDDELKELVASLAVDSKNLHEAQKATDEQMKRNDKMLTEKLDRMGITLGNIGKNQGDVAEEFFFQSLIKDNHLGKIHFDDVVKNMEKHRGNIQEEYDLVMTNGELLPLLKLNTKPMNMIWINWIGK